ncbi:MAG: transcriptional regulator, putative ATPase, winged helix family [Gammaproteobacteria bacterium]|nr:transcriptional regulator, putative ATPase, winged helix family [Gammaproteobacteria bacterium]
MKASPTFRIDTVHQCLWRRGGDGEERLSLAPKAYEVLHYLIDHPNRLITHDEFLKAVWSKVHVQPEILKSHILAIRTALGDKADEPRFIETVRGRGYRFIGPVAAFYAASRATTLPREQDSIVGRKEPLEELARLLSGAGSGEFQAAFVTGEPGIGKTALTHQFLTTALTQPDVFAATGRCVEGFAGAPEPYYPVLEALSSLCAGPLGATVVRALISAAPTWAIQMPALVTVEQRIQLQQQLLGTTRERMLREGCELIESLAADRTLVLVLEDLHWADYATLDFLSAMCRRRARSRLLVIATYRPADLGSARRPLSELAHDLSLRKLCTEISLGPLTRESVAEFLSPRADGQSSAADFIDLMGTRSGGNPLFLRATLHHLADRGLVTRTERGWRLLGTASQITFEVPSTLVGLIEARFERLSTTQQRVLESASITGMSFSASTTARPATLDPQEFEDACEDLSRRSCFINRGGMTILPDCGLVRTYRFTHALYRQVLYDRQGPVRRARLHLAVGERLEQIYPPDQRSELASELAQHFASGQEWNRALAYLRLALRTTQRRFAHRDALAIMDHATEIAAKLPADARIRVEIEVLERHAAIYRATHDVRAFEAFTRLAERAVQYGDVDIEVSALLGCSHAASCYDLKLSTRLLDQALEATARQLDSTSRDVARISIYVRRIWVAGWNESDARACDEAVDSLKGRGDRLAAARALINHSMIRMISTRYREAHDSFKENYGLLLDSPDELTESDIARTIWMYHVGVPWSLVFLGEFGEALAEYETGITAFERNEDHPAAHALGIYRGVLRFFAMDYSGVLEACEPVASHEIGKREYTGSEISRILPFERRMSLIFCGLAHVELGNLVAAREYLAATERAMELQPVHLDWYWRFPLEWGMVNLLIATADNAGAQIRAERYVMFAEATDERMWQSLAWETRARVALAQGIAAEAVEYIVKAQAASKGFETPLADWRVHDTAAAAYTAIGDRRQAGIHAQASIALRKRIARTLPEGHSLRLTLEGGVSERSMPA